MVHRGERVDLVGLSVSIGIDAPQNFSLAGFFTE